MPTSHFHILDTKLLLWLHKVVQLSCYKFNIGLMECIPLQKISTPLNLCKPKSITFLMWIASRSTTYFSVAHQGWTLKNWENLNFNKVFYALVIIFLVSIDIKNFKIMPHLEFEPHFLLLVNYELPTLLLGAYEYWRCQFGYLQYNPHVPIKIVKAFTLVNYSKSWFPFLIDSNSLAK